MDTDRAYAVFVDCTEIEISPKDREKYLSVVKPPPELEDWCKDLLLLGKREISNLVKWRGKVKDATKKVSRAKFDKIEYGAHDEEEEEDEADPESELYQIEKRERRAQEKLKEKKMLNFVKHNQVTGVNVAESDFSQEVGNFDFNRYGDLMRKGEVYTDFQAELEADDERLKRLGGRYHEYEKKEVKPYSEEEVMDNLEFLYEQKRQRKEDSEAKHRERALEKEKKKLRFLGENQDGEEDQAEESLKMNRLDDKSAFLRKRALDETSDRVEISDLKRSKWFDRDIFEVMEPTKRQIVQLPENYSEDEDVEEAEDDAEGDEEESYEDEEGMDEGEDLEDEESDGVEEGDEIEDDEGEEEDDESGDEEMDEDDIESEEAGEFDDLKDLKPLNGYEDDEIVEGDDAEEVELNDSDAEELKTKPKKGKKVAKKEDTKNLHTLYDDAEYEIFGGEVDEDEMLRDMHSSHLTKKDIQRLNRIKAFEKQEKEDRDGPQEEPMQEEKIEEMDDAHLTNLTPSQKKLLDKKNKKEFKSFRGQVNDRTIQVVPARKFEDYDTDELAADLALAKKMIRKKDREEILDMSFNKYNNFEYDGLPNWFTEDEKRHNYVNLPITKDEVREMREELKTMSEKPAKKVLEARFRRKRKLERQLKKFKNKADAVFEEEGMDEKGKAREVGKMRKKIVTADKAKRPKKKIIVGKKFKISAPGKKTTGKKYKIVDSRCKKEVRAEKRKKRQGNKGGNGFKRPSRKGKN